MKALPWMVVIALLGLTASSRAESVEVDFESLPPDLPGWSATLKKDDGDSEYRPAGKWDAPFTVALDSDKPRGGSSSLRWQFSAEAPGMISLMPPPIPVAGTDLTIRFFVRTESIEGEGLFSFTEAAADGKRTKSHWNVAKIPLSTDWTEVVWQGKIDAGTPLVRMSFVFKSMPAGAKVWIDDLSVVSE